MKVLVFGFLLLASTSAHAASSKCEALLSSIITNSVEAGSLSARADVLEVMVKAYPGLKKVQSDAGEKVTDTDPTQDYVRVKKELSNMEATTQGKVAELRENCLK